MRRSFDWLFAVTWLTVVTVAILTGAGIIWLIVVLT
jgi:hypothetical protein